MLAFTMHCHSALVAGLLTLQASAFLIPPNFANAAGKGQLEATWAAQPHIYALNCPGCPFVTAEEGDNQIQKDVENKILLDFRIDEKQKLRINDEVVFPLELSEVPNLSLFAHQVRTSDSQPSKLMPVGFALTVQGELDDAESDRRLFVVKFTILDLEGTPVEVDTIEISMVLAEEESRTFNIVKISTVPFGETPGAVTCAGASKWSLCRLRAIIASSLHEIIESAKAKAKATGAKIWKEKPGCSGKKAVDKFSQPKDGHHYRPNGGNHHRNRKMHHMLHRLGHMLHQAIRFFIVPALLGVIGGLMASAIGMLVGQLIVYMWFHFHRNGQRGQVRLVEVVAVDGEKDALIVSDELPPHYEDVEALPVEDEKQ